MSIISCLNDAPRRSLYTTDYLIKTIFLVHTKSPLRSCTKYKPLLTKIPRLSFLFPLVANLLIGNAIVPKTLFWENF